MSHRVMQQAFEAWYCADAARQGFDLSKGIEDLREGDGYGDHPILSGKWQGWQAALEQPAGWQLIDTAPTDNKRLLYLADFNENGEISHIDFDGLWEHESGTWETPENYWYWASANGIEEPTHWAFQDEALPTLAQPVQPADEKWVGKDVSILINYLRERTHFDADLIDRMLAFAINAPQPVQPVAPSIDYTALHEFASKNRVSYNELCSAVRKSIANAPVAQPVQPVRPAALGSLAERRIFDAIRSAYDMGYADARNIRSVPGDSAPGYKGREIEADHGGALLRSLNKTIAQPVQPAVSVVASEPPLSGRWHHGQGCLVSGTIRIAKWDCDTSPPVEFREDMLDWVCEALNAAVNLWEENTPDEFYTATPQPLVPESVAVDTIALTVRCIALRAQAKEAEAEAARGSKEKNT